MSNSGSESGARGYGAARVRLALPMVVFAVAGAFGCTPYATLRTPPAGCTATDAATSPAAGYEFQSVDTFEGETTPSFFTSQDTTPISVMTVTLATPPDGAPCGSTLAMEAQAANNDDWGSLIGYNNFGPRDASAYEGLSFWARTTGSSNNALTILFDDPNTYNDNTQTVDGGIILPTPPTADCTKYPTPDGGATSTGVITDSNGNVLSSGTASAPLPPNGCGNNYWTVMLVTGAWELYTIPFGKFQQNVTPNQVPNPGLPTTGNAAGTSLITSRLLTFTLRFPKGAPTNLWLDDIGFYRHKGWAPPGRDGGVDASM
jgi:hypothetical protein